MATPLYNAWRFIHPDFDMAEQRKGLQISSTGGIDMVDEVASVRQAILVLLTTSPGERVMRPEYGSYLRRLVFAPNDATTHGEAIQYVRQAINQWEPRIEILHLDARANELAPERMEIVLDYRVVRTARRDKLVFFMQLTGEVV